MSKNSCRFLFAMLLLITAAGQAATLQKQKDGVMVQLPDGFLDVRFFSETIVHVQFAKDRRFFNHKTLDVVEIGRAHV